MATVINVYDNELNLIGVLDDFVSIIWRPSYYEVGDFELYINATSQGVALLQPERFVARNSDVIVDPDGNRIIKNMMIIKNITITTDSEKGDYIIVTGREVKFILHQRIVWSQTNLTGSAEGAIRQLVTENAIAPSDPNRIIPNLVLGAESGLTATIDKQTTGDALDVVINEICQNNNYGWDMYAYNNQLVFIVYQGLDRSYGQTDRPYVVFSDAFENLFNTEYQLTTEEYANTALIAGEGEGTARKSATVNGDLTGLARYEVYVDARDLSQNKGQSDAIPDAKYLLLLEERGAETLAELNITEGFSGNVVSDGNFKYGVDYDIGDTVTVINRYGLTKNVMVLSAIESEDENGVSLIPQFNI